MMFIHMYMQQQLGNQIAHMKGQPQGWNDTSSGQQLTW